MSKEIKQYMNNDLLDLKKIVDEYSNYIRKIVENMTCIISNEDIDEIVSDTFFILWKNSAKLDKEKSLSSYIAGITRNLVKEKLRLIKKDYNIADYENIILDFQEVDMLCEEREKTAIIKKALLKLKDEDINIFNLYYYSSRRISEISNVLNISEFKVKSRLHRIRKKIKVELEKGGYSYNG